MEGQEIPSELFREGGPVGKAETTTPRFAVKLTSRPVAGASSRHVGHHPVNLGGIIREGLRVITNAGPAGGPKGHPSRAVAIELHQREGFIKNLKRFLPARGRCTRCGMHEEGGIRQGGRRRGYNVSRRLAANGLGGYGRGEREGWRGPTGLPKWPSGCATASGAGSLGGPFSTVRATAVGRDAERNAVVAGDPKGLVYYVMID